MPWSLSNAPHIKKHPLIILFTVLATIALVYTVVLLIYVVYVQSIGSDIGIFSGLFISALVPMKPAEDKPSRRLTKAEKSQFTLSDELRQILVGLLLGDFYGEKRAENVRLRFDQGTIHNDYLMHRSDFKIFYGKIAVMSPFVKKISKPKVQKLLAAVMPTIMKYKIGL